MRDAVGRVVTWTVEWGANPVNATLTVERGDSVR